MAIQRWLGLLPVRWARYDPGGHFDSIAPGQDLKEEVSLELGIQPRAGANVVNPTSKGPAVEKDVRDPSRKYFEAAA